MPPLWRRTKVPTCTASDNKCTINSQLRMLTTALEQNTITENSPAEYQERELAHPMTAASIHSRSILLLSLLFIIASCSAAGEENNQVFPAPIGSHCYTNPKFNGSNDVDLRQNVDKATELVVKHTLYTTYINLTVGVDGDYTIYVLAQCRRDVNASECSTCVTHAAQAITKVCQYQPDARVWYDHCFLRYDTEDFVQQLDVGPYVHKASPQLVPSTVTNLSDVLYKCFNTDIGHQLSKPENRGYGKASRQIDNVYNVTGTVQCTQDLDPDEALLAMTSGVRLFDTYCRNHSGCVVASSSCYVKYDVYPSNATSKAGAKGARKLLSFHGSP